MKNMDSDPQPPSPVTEIPKETPENDASSTAEKTANPPQNGSAPGASPPAGQVKEQPKGSGPAVTVEEYMQMDDVAKASLSQSRRKKLEKLSLRRAEKEAKAARAAAAGKPIQKKGSGGGKKEKRKKSEAQAADDAENQHVDDTPAGEFKRLTPQMAPKYKPRAVESAWYAWWEQKGFFSPDPSEMRGKGEDKKFVMVLPPPNVTGSLHLGHALMCAVEDAVARFNRMQGRITLWVPGVDHAGIATQAVVEKQLARTRGIDRRDLGRDKFVEEVWKWKEEYGGKIVNQLRRIGSSMDWKREEFTMSDKLSNAVKEAFVRFYDDGLLYRANRLVNVSCALRTALSNIEVDTVEIDGFTKRKVPGYDELVEFGVLTKFAYKVDGSDEELIVATTRIETMLGDTGVAVHPNDDRYKHLHGKMLLHPFVDRKVPIITDSELVDMDFGTGAVKVTPAHDDNDFACGKRNNLPQISVINENGDINENGGEFCGMKRYTARLEVEKKLSELGLLRGKDANPMALKICSRSGDVVERMVKPQWYLNCKGLAKQSADAVRNGDLKIVPPSFEVIWYNWLDEIQDWCVSRQLWWGHRIPAYMATISGDAAKDDSAEDVWVVGRTEDEARKRAAEKLNVSEDQIVLKQDEDVLDTWFSSGLFPFSVFGWPNKTEEMDAFFPTTMLETGHDILFFWVARMVMMSLGLTGKLPFKTVLLHSLVRDKRGRKMSKSLGNVIDPLEVINGASLETLLAKLKNSNLVESEVKRAAADQKEDYPDGIPECGADSLRIGLLAYMQQGGDINLDVQRVIGYRNFGNKLWQATRFAISNLGFEFQFSKDGLMTAIHKSATFDLWILSRLNETSKEVNDAFDSHRIGDAVHIAYKFWMTELCAVYLEGIKPIMRGDDAEAILASKMVLYECLSAGLRMLHPFMPYVTEELFQRLPGPKTSESIMIAPFPTYCSSRKFHLAEEKLAAVQRCVQALRQVKTEFGLKPSAAPAVFIMAANAEAAEAIEPACISALSPTKSLEVLIAGESDSPDGATVGVVDALYEVHVVLSGVVDVQSEVRKLSATSAQKELRIASLRKKMSAKEYGRVPENVKNRNQKQLDEQLGELSKLKNVMAKLTLVMNNDNDTTNN